MRFLAIGLTAALLALPVAVPANACNAGAHSATAASVDYAAKKKPKKMAKHRVRKKKEKVEYMRAAPMPPGAK